MLGACNAVRKFNSSDYVKAERVQIKREYMYGQYIYVEFIRQTFEVYVQVKSRPISMSNPR